MMSLIRSLGSRLQGDVARNFGCVSSAPAPLVVLGVVAPNSWYGGRSFASLNFKRVSNKVTSSYIMDPYAMLMHYKRVFKLLGSMRRLPGGQRARVLVLGNKHQFGIDWKNRFQ